MFKFCHIGIGITTYILPECYQQSDTSSLSKAILVLGKARSHRAPNLGCRGPESPGWFDVLPKNSALDMMHEWACCPDEAANHQLPIDAAFWIIQVVSSEECSRLMQNRMQTHCSIHSVILNVIATQYTCPLNGVSWPHSLVQSSLFTHAHSSPLSLAARLHWCCTNHSHYINNRWTFSRQTLYVL